MTFVQSTFANDLNYFSSKCVENNIITLSQSRDIQGTMGISSTQKASKLVSAISGKFEFEPQKYWSILVKMFEREAAYSGLASRLQQAMINQQRSTR